MLTVGAVAPDFPVEGDSLQALASRGQVVVFFFPKAFTAG